MLITSAYQQEQQNLHEINPAYGQASVGYAALVDDFIRRLNTPSLLDYGAGKGRLAQHLKEPVRVTEYDPAIPAKAGDPGGPFRFVVCIDVLEHVEPECLDAVLDDLQLKTRKHLFCTIHTGAAVKVLSDGRNAHLTQQLASWWLPKLLDRFEIEQLQVTPHGFWTLLYR